MTGHVLVIDQGTTSTRAIIFGRGRCARRHGAGGIPANLSAAGLGRARSGGRSGEPRSRPRAQALSQSRRRAERARGLGIANQRETTLVWNRTTGQPIHNAIVWQDRRTAPLCAELKARRARELVSERTGLLLDPYFSATKIAWMLDNVAGARAEADAGELPSARSTAFSSGA